MRRGRQARIGAAIAFSLAAGAFGFGLGRATAPEQIDNECLAALLLVTPEDRDRIPEDELEARCPGAKRFHIT